MNIRASSILCILFFLVFFSVFGKGNLKYVNPLIGTAPTLQPSKWDGHGRTYPGAAAPFGFIQLTPETRIFPSPGYDYRDSVIHFFSCLGHYSGYPNGSSGFGKIMLAENLTNFKINQTCRPFSHQNEIAEPGYYKVAFSDNGTIVETTASTRTGTFRITFSEKIKPKVFIGDIGCIKLLEKRIVKGERRNVLIEFDQPWEKVEKSDGGYVFFFNEKEDKLLKIKLSSSSVSFQNSRSNLEMEIPGWDFDLMKEETQNKWKDELEVIEVEDQSVENKTKFYTALYHSLLFPWIVSDTDGSYRGYDGKIYKVKGNNQYDTFSTWDTFRSLHPLFCIIAPYRQEDMIISMLEIYKQTGRLPNGPMTGFHSVPIIVDSYFKNIADFDVRLGYKAMKDNLLKSDNKEDDYISYMNQGYVPDLFAESVTRTVEYAYDDWAFSRFAKEMAQADDYQYFLKRSLNYRNLFDSQQLFLVPRGENGFTISTNHFGYKEGDKWSYSFFVPHNVRDLINLKGGNIEFAQHLDSVFTNQLILFDNEPVFHIPYLFNYAKDPSKTQKWISRIRQDHFTAGANGLPGNDDLGSMSSWFVFSAMGFSPVCPGMPEYQIGTPLFETLTIHLSNGNDFVIRAENTSTENIYIQSARINGLELNHSWFTHEEILVGSEILFVQGPSPSDWGVNADSVSYSVTKEEANIIVESIWSVTKELKPHEPFPVYVSLKNNGATGVKKIKVYSEGKEIGSKNIYVKADETLFDSVDCRLYKSGVRFISLEGIPDTVEVKVTDLPVSNLLYSPLSLKPLIALGEVQYVRFLVKNAGNIKSSENVDLVLNDKIIQSQQINLSPGESKELVFKVTGFRLGMNIISVDGLSEVFKVYANKRNATFVDFNLDSTKDGRTHDLSGFSNTGVLSGILDNQSLNFFSGSSCVEIENSASLSALDSELTIMAWVKTARENSGTASIITHGDNTVIQIIHNQTIQFFSGGWGRGACEINVPPNFFDEWHHFTGTVDGLKLKFYINGILKQTVDTENHSRLSVSNIWCVGGNAEFPNQRMFKGEINKVKIFGVALTENEINQIVNKEKNNFL